MPLSSTSPTLSLTLPSLCFFTNLCVIFLRLFFNKFFIVCLSEQKKGGGGERGKVEVEIVDGPGARGKRCVY